MNRAPQVKLEGLIVTAIEPLKETAVILPPQACAIAELQPGEMVEVHNLSTGRFFVAMLRVGKPGQVQVNGWADLDLSRGDQLRVLAGARMRTPSPGACTSCLCEGNAVIEYRHFTAPILGAAGPDSHDLAAVEPAVWHP